MEKIININFQGRVIPIEETAYNSLKQYIDSLRTYFAGEESSDEIINDIENRIAELLSERLKQGISCVTPADVTAVINNIGKLEDIEAADGEETMAPPKQARPESAPTLPYKGRLFRNTDDKVIAGVCSGLAIRLGMDPVVLRVIFVLLFGAFFPIYLLLWIIVPSKSVTTNITRRLYRNPDDKVVAGVCGGLAVYFRTESWIMRLVFAAPLFAGFLFRGFNPFIWQGNWGFGPHIFLGSLGSTLFILYVILWIALPYASSATDKLEMRGEKIDLNSIKNATQANAASAQKQRYSGFGRVIGILFKAFFLFIGGTIAVSLFGVLIGLLFAGTVAMPFTNFVLAGWQQYTLAWAGIVLFLGIPLLALVTWIVRRIIGARSRRHYLGYVFSGLWIIGFMSVLILSSIIIKSFSSKSMIEEAYPLHQPTANKLYINVSSSAIPGISARHSKWYGDWTTDNNGVFHMVGNDSIWLNTVKVNVVKSDDSLFHIYETRISRGNTSEEAKDLASHLVFNIEQQDSLINLPGGFAISNKDKFRNQQVMVTVEVPVGKAIQFDDHVRHYNWFSINSNNHNAYNIQYSSDDDDNDYRSNSAYTMTSTGLKNPQDSLDNKKNKNDDEEDDDDK